MISKFKVALAIKPAALSPFLLKLPVVEATAAVS